VLFAFAFHDVIVYLPHHLITIKIQHREELKELHSELARLPPR
jgi:hypothetical protein